MWEAVKPSSDNGASSPALPSSFFAGTAVAAAFA
jgi:hypothetical protein